MYTAQKMLSGNLKVSDELMCGTLMCGTLYDIYFFINYAIHLLTPNKLLFTKMFLSNSRVVYEYPHRVVCGTCQFPL